MVITFRRFLWTVIHIYDTISAKNNQENVWVKSAGIAKTKSTEFLASPTAGSAFSIWKSVIWNNFYVIQIIKGNMRTWNKVWVNTDKNPLKCKISAIFWLHNTERKLVWICLLHTSWEQQRMCEHVTAQICWQCVNIITHWAISRWI